MNEVLQVMMRRRSIRKYTDQPIREESLRQILQAGLVSESAHNRKAYELLVVRDREMLRKMAGCRVGSAKHLEQADAAIVVLGKTEADTWIEDSVIVLANMHLMASALGVGSCIIQGRMRYAADGSSTEAYLRNLLGYPETMPLQGLLALGMPGEERPAYRAEELHWEKVHRERY
ncbi:MAG: nitroreductase [Ruminococcaceae bacterium]|nr:nitroreductase [Oscillospiraceae bacterium]